MQHATIGALAVWVLSAAAGGCAEREGASSRSGGPAKRGGSAGGSAARGSAAAPAVRSSTAFRWPRWPRDTAAVARLVARFGAPRSKDGATAITRERLTVRGILALLRRARARRTVAAGWPAIRARLQRWIDQLRASRRDGFLLWGTYHDSAGQLRAFRRLLPPAGLRGLTHVAVEQFDADGGWRGLPRAAQRGVTRELTTFLASGEKRAWERIFAVQRRDNYTAWKYSYLPEVMDLVIAARAAGLPLLGCDMNSGLQRRARRRIGEDALMRLRELHCALALRAARGGRPQRAAMLWGQDHLEPRGVGRFLARFGAMLSVYVFGDRPAASALEARLGARLAITAPLLMGEGPRAVLLLPGRHLGATVERTRDLDAAPVPPQHGASIMLRSQRRGTLHVGDQVVALGRRSRALELRRGASHPFVFEREGVLIAGAFATPAAGYLVVEIEPRRRAVRFTWR